MEDFTRNINLRALSVSDFVEIPEGKYTTDSYEKTMYMSSDQFENIRHVKIIKTYYKSSKFTIFYLLYLLDDSIFCTEADTFEEVLKAFNDWRMKMYSDLLFLPDNKTITIKMTGYANNF